MRRGDRGPVDIYRGGDAGETANSEGDAVPAVLGPTEKSFEGWSMMYCYWFFFQAEDGIRGRTVTGVQTCALPISHRRAPHRTRPAPRAAPPPPRTSRRCRWSSAPA